MREEVKYDFNNYDYSGITGCPRCEAIKRSNGQPIPIAHPETVSLLCQAHYEQFKKWHDKEVEKGNIQSWFLTNLS